ncbi:unnamed protein product [Spirodela intermedia]|uniref:CGL160/ATPI domain-containing protein n=1 Tax=Spirodela intermedia TaxID=51605 RepID=A0A7I8IVA4_SPIIN|nr:unnamed protein product [Spirodela intermedia]CAA6661935.1 unnamed protein product [Spirodela intermedia]
MNALWLRTGSGAEISSLSLFFNGASSTVRAPAFNGSRRRRSLRVASLRSYLPRDDVIGEDLLREFLRERLTYGDFISKVSDILWNKGALGDVETEENAALGSYQNSVEVDKNEDVDGFLKLAKTREWILGDDTAPLNKRTVARDWRNDSEKRRKLNLLQYEALKKELTLLTIGIGTACGGYCLITLSLQAAVSYAAGVLLSCLYLQLLSSHVDNLSKEAVPSIFLQKKTKKIGIRSEDLQRSLERTVKGCGMALSSPRLVFPAAIYGLWALSNHFSNDYFEFQLVPAMLGLFAYKAAALVQVYRDNKELSLVLPEDGS